MDLPFLVYHQHIKLSKKANNVHSNSLLGYLAKLWWHSLHKTMPLNDFLEEVVNNIPCIDFKQISDMLCISVLVTFSVFLCRISFV